MKKLLSVVLLAIVLSSCSKAPKQVETPSTVVASPIASPEPSVSPTVEPSPQISEQKRKEHETVERLNKAFEESNLRLAIAKEKNEEEYKRNQICDTQKEMFEQYRRPMSKECLERVTKQGNPPVDRFKEAEQSASEMPPLETFHAK